MKRKNTKIWVTLLVLPVPLLVIPALLQFVLKAANLNQGSGVALVVNLLTIVVGVAAVLLLLCMPIWIVMLAREDKLNKQPTITPAAPVPAPAPQVVTPTPRNNTNKLKTAFQIILAPLVLVGFAMLIAQLFGNHSPHALRVVLLLMATLGLVAAPICLIAGIIILIQKN